jgi:hypothetical protein
MIELTYVATSNKLNETLASIRSVMLYPPFPDYITIVTDNPQNLALQDFQVPIRLKKLEPVIARLPLGNKIIACDSDADFVIYLDNDTYANSSICELVSNDNLGFDIRARVASIYVNGKISHKVWDGFFRERNLAPVPMWNTGVICIKSGVSKRLGMLWKKWFIELDRINFSHICEPFAMDQLALSLAVSEIKCMTADLSPLDHSFEWEHENPFKSTIHHTSSNFYRRSLIRYHAANLFGFRSFNMEMLLTLEKVARNSSHLFKK